MVNRSARRGGHGTSHRVNDASEALPEKSTLLDWDMTMTEYKVITQDDQWFNGRFNGPVLQKVLNDHARVGWTVKSMVSASREGALLGSNRDEIIVLLERTMPVPPPQMVPSEAAPPVAPPTPEELHAALQRQEELDRELAMIDATVGDPAERQRLKLKLIGDAY